jgi:hypothetical protein
MDGCDVERCALCGGQAISCGCEWPPSLARLPWTGTWPGQEDCERLGFWCIGDGPPGNHWRPVPVGTPGATHDLNRLFKDARWNRRTRRFEAR